MLAIATEITLSVMSFDVRTTLLVQAACPLDNSTDTQAVFINTTSLMTSPYLLLVTGSLRSNLSRAKCTAQVGMSYRLGRKHPGNCAFAEPELLRYRKPKRVIQNEKKMAIQIPMIVTTIMMKVMMKYNSLKEIVKGAHNDTQLHNKALPKTSPV